MANLRVNKITSTETFEKTGSVQFDGSGDVLTVPNSADFRLGNDDFTIEFWFVYDGTIASTRTLFSLFENASVDRRSYQTEVRSDGVIRFEYTTDGSSGISFDSEAGTISAGTWYHYAVTRTNGIITQYLNGASVSIGFVSTNSFFNNTDDPFRIGALNAAVNQPFTGHITNFRVVKGKALYTANFKPPMRELEVTPETTLLCCQSKTDASLEKTGKTITVNGNVVASELTPGLLTPVPKDGAGSAITGSVEFTSTNDALVLSAGEDFAYGTGDFTIEAWIQPQGAVSGETKAIFTQTQSGNDYIVFKVDSDKAIKATFGSTTVSGGTVEVGSWHHVAVTRASNTVKIFVNGVASAGTTVSTDFSDTTRNPTIGQYTHTYGNIEYYGFISNFRIVKGTALYTDSFIPPTRELKKVPGTVLLCCQDPNDPTTEATGKTITGYGNLDADTSSENLITNGNFTTSASDGWTVVEGTGSTALGTAQSGTFNDGNHLVLTATSGSFVFLAQQFTTKIGSTYLVNVQSNGADASFISTDSDKDNAIITDIRNTGGNNKVGDQTFVATQTSYYMILRGGTGGGNFDTASVYKVLTPNGASNFTPQVGDDRQVTFEGVTKVNSDAYFYLPTGDTESRYPIGANTIGNGRAVFSSGTTPSTTNTVDYITISSKGDAQDFGGMGQNQGAVGTVSDSTRGIFAGGQNPVDNRIEYITISSTGDAKDFGDMTRAGRFVAGAGNAIRGCLGGGLNSTNTIDYITIQSMGNAFDFGDLVSARGQCSGLASPTRGIFAGGHAHPSPSNSVQVIDFISIMSTGNAQDFGDLINNNSEDQAGASNEVRGLFAGGSPAGNANQEVIQYITIASTGDATDFGNLVVGATSKGGAASPTRAVFAGGYTNPGTTMTDAMDFVTITSTGNAQDFGDLTQARDQLNGVSNAHGGLG